MNRCSGLSWKNLGLIFKEKQSCLPPHFRDNFFQKIAAAFLHQDVTPRFPKFSINIFFSSLIAPYGDLFCWKFQNLLMLVVFLDNPSHLICLQNYRLDIIHQRLSGLFCLCIKLLDKHIPKYIRTLIG